MFFNHLLVKRVLIVGGLFFLLIGMSLLMERQALRVPLQKTDSNIPTSVPDPGEAGKATLAGIDINNNGVRDDVEVYIEQTVTDSARHREALKDYARAIQQGFFVSDRTSAMIAGDAEIRAYRCIVFLGKHNELKWKEVTSLMANTPERYRALDNLGELQDGRIIREIRDSQYREQCNFDIEALPN